MSDDNSLEDLFQRIRDALVKQAANLNTARQVFQIVPRSQGAYPERAISHFAIRAACDAVDGIAILEAGFPNDSESKNDNHLDALIFNDEIAILAEFKRAWTPSHWKGIAADAVRIERFGPAISKRFNDTDKPKRRLFALYGLDAWRVEIANAWRDESTCDRWKLPDKFKAMKRGYVVVWTEPNGRQPGTDYDGYYLLFAIEQLNAEW